jgi:hypothetical protein
MKLSINDLAKYLDQSFERMSHTAPFAFQTVEKNVDDKLPDIRIDYKYSDIGVDVVSDGNGLVNTIFIHVSDINRFTAGIQIFEAPVGSTRLDIRNWFGKPEASGEKSVSKYLGESGSWDRFVKPSYIVHVQFNCSPPEDLQMLTLMSKYKS